MRQILVLLATLFLCANLMAAGSDSSSSDSSGGESNKKSLYLFINIYIILEKMLI